MHLIRRFVLVAGVVSCLAGATPIPTDDLLIFRGGTIQRGLLKSCVGNQCQLKGTAYSKQAIEWIGFAMTGTRPPAISNLNQDEVHLRDGRIHAGKLIGVGSSDVVLQTGEFKRADVAWIHLAPLAGQKPSDSGPIIAESPSTPSSTPQKPKKTTPDNSGGSSSSEKAGDNASGDQPPKGPRPTNRTPVKPCPADKPLGGWVKTWDTYDQGGHNPHCEYTVRTTLRFHLVPSVKAWPFELGMVYRAPEVDYEIYSDGAHTIPNDREICRSDPATAKGTAPGWGGIGDSAWIEFHPLRPELNLHNSNGIHGPQQVQETHYLNGAADEWGTQGYSIAAPSFSVEPPRPEKELMKLDPDPARAAFGCFRPQLREWASFCTRPTVCDHATDPEVQKDCHVNADRYAVIPFEDEVNWSGPYSPDERSRINFRMRWKVCCGCDETGPPPEPETGCKDTSQYQGQVDRLANVSRCDREDLKKKYDEFQHAWSQAEQFRSDFDLVSRSCAEFALAKTLLSYLTGKGEIDTVKDFVLLEAVLEKMVNQDPSAVLNFSNLEVEVGGQAISVDVALLWETMMKISEAMHATGEAGSVEGLGTRLNDCAGTPMVSDAVWQGAKDYLRNLKDATEMMPELRQQMGDIERTDQDRWKAENDLYQACLEYAKCKGFPPHCTPPPDGPTAPAPGQCNRATGAPGGRF